MPTTSSIDGTRWKVEFRLPPEANAQRGCVVGDFNGWRRDETLLEKQPDGSLTVAIELEAGRSYRFRYLLDGDRWENDWAADAYVENEHGGSDSVVTVPNAPAGPADRGRTGDGPGPRTEQADADLPPPPAADGVDLPTA